MKFPQYQNAAYVGYANYRTGLDANVTATEGDVLEFTPTANRTATLPPVASGGPVLVRLGGTFGAGNFVRVVLSASDLASGVTIDGGAKGPVNSIQLNNAGDQVVLASDGSNWWQINKCHNTHDTW
jgi:hypothetical protein